MASQLRMASSIKGATMKAIRPALHGFMILPLAVAGCSGSKSRTYNSTVAPATSGTTGVSSSTSSTQPGVNPSGLPTQPPVGTWWKGDMHSHSAPYSQDADRQFGDRPGTCFFLAESAGLDYLALTDHRTLDQVNDSSYSAQTLTILDGEEWGGTTHHGMVGLTQLVPEIDTSLGAGTLNAQMQQAYDEAHRQGAIVIANHPAQDSKVHIWLSHTFDAVEVWNAYWNFPKGYKDAKESDIDDKLDGLGLSQIGENSNPEIREAVRHKGGGANHQAIKFWEANLNRGRHMAAVGGGDRHSLTFPGIPTTYVFAPTKSRADLLQAVKDGRTWVGSAGGPVVDFSADGDQDGVFESIIGDSVPLNRPVDYTVRVQNGQGGKVEIIKNGSVFQTFALLSNDDTFTFTDTASSQSWYRVDVFEPVNFNVANSNGFQLLALTGTLLGQSGTNALATIATPLGFQVSIGTTRIPQIRLPHEYDVILNFDRTHWGYARGAITSPIWSE